MERPVSLRSTPAHQLLNPARRHRYPVKDTLIPSSDPEKPYFIPARASYVPPPSRALCD